MFNSLKNWYLKRDIYIIATFIFIFGLIFYGSGAATTVQGGDSGEFSTLLDTIGVGHPPGYPVYLYLSHFFVRILPFTNHIYSASIVSSLYSSIALSVLFLSFTKLTNDKMSSVISILCLGTSNIFWKYSTVPEVFSLNALNYSLLLYFVINIWINPKRLTNYLFLGLSFGIGVGNHHSIIFLLPFCVTIITMVNNHNYKKLVNAIMLFLLGTIPGFLIYLPFLYIEPKGWSWYQPQNLKDFVDLFLRKDYSTLPKPSTQWWLNTIYYFRNLPKTFHYLFFLFGTFGIYKSISKNKNSKLFLNLLIAFFLSGPFFLSIFDITAQGRELLVLERFLISSHLIFTFFISQGIHKYNSLITSKRNYYLFQFLFLLLIVISAKLNYSKVTHKGWTVLEDYAINCLNQVEPKSIIIGHGDTDFSAFIYLKHSKGYRKDVIYISPPLVVKKWYRDYLKNQTGDIDLNEWHNWEMSPEAIIAKLISIYSSKRPIFLLPDYWNTIKKNKSTSFFIPYKALLIKFKPEGTFSYNLREIEKEMNTALEYLEINSMPSSNFDYTNRWEGIAYKNYGKTFQILRDKYYEIDDTVSAERVAERAKKLILPWYDFTK